MTKSRVGIFPGTLDPITLGHVDIIERALQYVVEELVIAIYDNKSKNPLFTVDQRVAMASEVLAGKKVKVLQFSGLLVDFARTHKACVSIRGIRSISDFEYEFRMCYVNNRLDSNHETVFIPASGDHQYTSSTLVREIAKLGGNVSKFVPPSVEAELISHFQG